MTFIDFFCGMGTIRMGFEQAGHECVYSVEWDKHKRRIYEVIFGKEPDGNDITTVRANDLPRSDCWTFGAPCQDFSIAGLRSGLDGDRSSLIREVFRLVRETPEEYRPEWLFYENVKGMLSSNRGLDYLEILFEMASLGYDIQYELLNSKDFGVPQNRERVYTLGHLRRYGERKVFPIGENDKLLNGTSSTDAGQPQAKYCATALRASGNMKADGTYIMEIAVKQIENVMPTTTRDNPNQGRVYGTDGLAPCLNKMEGGGREPMIIASLQEHAAVKDDGICPTITGAMGMGGGQIPMVVSEPCACLTPGRLEKRQNGRRFKEPGEPMFTLTKQDIHGVVISSGIYLNDSERFHKGPLEGLSRCLKAEKHDAGVLQNQRIRRLTPRECMRLQGVPDYITDKLISVGISDTQLYRAAGDACTVNVIYEIAKRLEVSNVQ